MSHWLLNILVSDIKLVPQDVKTDMIMKILQLDLRRALQTLGLLVLVQFSHADVVRDSIFQGEAWRLCPDLAHGSPLYSASVQSTASRI